MAHLVRISLPPSTLLGLTMERDGYLECMGLEPECCHSISSLWYLYTMPWLPPPKVLFIYLCVCLSIYLFTCTSILLVFPVRSSLLLCASEVSAGSNTPSCFIYFYRNNIVLPRESCHFTTTLAFPEATLFSFHSTFNPLGSLLPHTASEEKLDYAKNINTEKQMF